MLASAVTFLATMTCLEPTVGWLVLVHVSHCPRMRDGVGNSIPFVSCYVFIDGLGNGMTPNTLGHGLAIAAVSAHEPCLAQGSGHTTGPHSTTLRVPVGRAAAFGAGQPQGCVVGEVMLTLMGQALLN